MWGVQIDSPVVIRRLWGAFAEVEGVVKRVTPSTITVEITRLGGRQEMRPGYTIEYREGDGWIVEYPPSLLSGKFAELGVKPTPAQWERLEELLPYVDETENEYVLRCLAELV